MTARKIILLVVLVLIVIFVLQNTEVVNIRFLFWKATLSEAIVLLGALAIGLVGGLVRGRLMAILKAKG